MAEAQLFDVMYSMRAMRRLKPNPIPEEVLKKIIDAGIHAPSGGNLQDWAFILNRNLVFRQIWKSAPCCRWGTHKATSVRPNVNQSRA
jgi:nitroreductase